MGYAGGAVLVRPVGLGGDISARSRNPVAHDGGAPPRVRGEYAMVEDQVDSRSRRERGQACKEVQGLKDEVAGAIRPRGLQLEYDATARGEQEPILRHSRPQEIAAELLEALAIRAGHGNVGVKVEAVKWSGPRLAGCDG